MRKSALIFFDKVFKVEQRLSCKPFVIKIANKFRKSQMRNFADLDNLLDSDLSQMWHFADLRFGTCGFKTSENPQIQTLLLTNIA
jgi:hypothetical protein